MKLNLRKYLVFSLMIFTLALLPFKAMAGGDPGPQMGGDAEANTEAGLTDSSLKKCKACAGALKNTVGGSLTTAPTEFAPSGHGTTGGAGATSTE